MRPTGDYKVIPLLGDHVTVVDADDYDRLMQRSWACNNKGYATTRINGRTIPMQRVILNLTDPDYHAHHINRIPLDNRKSNLEVMRKEKHQRLPHKPHTPRTPGTSNPLSDYLWEQKIKQITFAKNLGISNSSISNFITGKRTLGPRALKAICGAIDDPTIVDGILLANSKIKLKV